MIHSIDTGKPGKGKIRPKIVNIQEQKTIDKQPGKGEHYSRNNRRISSIKKHFFKHAMIIISLITSVPTKSILFQISGEPAPRGGIRDDHWDFSLPLSLSLSRFPPG